MKAKRRTLPSAADIAASLHPRGGWPISVASTTQQPRPGHRGGMHRSCTEPTGEISRGWRLALRLRDGWWRRRPPYHQIQLRFASRRVSLRQRPWIRDAGPSCRGCALCRKGNVLPELRPGDRRIAASTHSILKRRRRVALTVADLRSGSGSEASRTDLGRVRT